MQRTLDSETYDAICAAVQARFNETNDWGQATGQPVIEKFIGKGYEKREVEEVVHASLTELKRMWEDAKN